MNQVAEAYQWAMTDEDHLATLKAEVSLRDYIPLVWSVLEPSRPFKSGWAIDAICDHLQAITEGYITKLLINVPPGFMKSLSTCVFWPSWEWGPRNRPDLRYVASSYSDALTVRDNRKMRFVIQSEAYQARWGHRFHMIGDQNAKQKFENNQRGYKLATSVGGLGTGERGDRQLIDDPHNVRDGESEPKREGTLGWFTETMSTRVNDPGISAFIVIMQRVHQRDVSGLILEQEMGYTHLMIPMNYEYKRRCLVYVAHPRSDELEEGMPETFEWEDPRTNEDELAWEERYPEDYVENDLKPALRAWGGSYAESGQLQQSPIPRGGGMFQRGDFQYIDSREVSKLVGRRCRGWDLAASDTQTAAYTSGVKGMIDQHGRLIILDVVRERKLPNGVKELMKECAEQDGKACEIDAPQDPGQAGKAQKVDLAKNVHGWTIRFSPETGPKTTRAAPVSAQAEAHNIFLVRASWNDPFVDELVVFPNGKYKDQADATSRMYANLNRKGKKKPISKPKIIQAVA